jgi:hypothetical protein
LRKNRIKLKALLHFLLIVPIFVLGIFTNDGVNIFSLSFTPFNAETTAQLEDDSLRFSEIGQTLSVTLEKPIAFGTFRVSIQGFQVTIESDQLQTPVFSLLQGTKVFKVHRLEKIGWISIPVYHLNEGVITLTFQNFATLEGNMLPYDVIIDGLDVFDRSL